MIQSYEDRVTIGFIIDYGVPSLAAVKGFED